MERLNRPSPLVPWFFFLSGIAGLVYEVVWARLLERVMGASVYSITTVLTVYMAGLALGSFLAGKFIDRRDDPLRIYGVLQGVIGIYCLLVPAIVAATVPIYRAAYQSFEAGFHTFSLVRFAISGLVLLVPTTLMGATLPVLSKYMARRFDRVGESVGGLYAINTLGAVVGSFAAGFVLMPGLGMRGTIVAAAAVNIVVAGLVLLLYRNERSAPPAGGAGAKAKRTKRQEQGEPKEAAPAGHAPPPDGGRLKPVLALVLVAFALSGFAAMVYQVAWMRTLSLVVGSSVYAVSTILTAYILGLGLGAAVFSRYVDRIKDAVAGMGILELGIGAAALAVVPILGRLPLVMVGVVERHADSFGMLMAVQFGLVFLVILIPTLLLGAVFPTVVRLFTTRLDSIGRSVGDVYASNTLGAIVGSFAGGFLLIPALGIQRSIAVAVIINVALGAGLLALSPTLSRGRKLAGAAVAALVLALFLPNVPRWDPVIMSSGAYLYADMYAEEAGTTEGDLEEAVKVYGEVLYHEEGVVTTVTVREARDELYLQANGKTEASTGPDMKTQKLLAHVPMMLHEEPGSVLVIGLASGVTVAAAEKYPVETIDCVEIAPAMVEVARTYFAEANDNCLEDPRVNIIVEDGRNHVAFTDAGYDVMISQPSNPWIVGISNLFTREFFQLAHDRMNPGGIVGFWFQAYNMSPDEFRMIVRTFSEVFEEMSLWELDPGVDYMLVGAVDGGMLDHEILMRRFDDPRIGRDLLSVGLDEPIDYTGLFVFDDSRVDDYAENAPVHTDDNLKLEFSAPRSMHRRSLGEQLSALAPHRMSAEAILTNVPEGEQGEQFIEAAAARSRARAFLARGLVANEAGRLQEALDAYVLATQESPGESEAIEAASKLLCQVGSSNARAGRDEEALPYFRTATEIGPDLPQPRCLLGAAYLRLGRLDEARRELELAVDLDPDYADAYYNLGLLYSELGMTSQQVEAFERYLEHAPTARNAEQVRSWIRQQRGESE
ncbi:MAG: MFS transporter [Candidatus Eisenbacteria bacterium]|nr:MFS transporter [Candidatus Eisenbacteria bacterium]